MKKVLLTLCFLIGIVALLVAQSVNSPLVKSTDSIATKKKIGLTKDRWYELLNYIASDSDALRQMYYYNGNAVVLNDKHELCYSASTESIFFTPCPECLWIIDTVWATGKYFRVSMHESTGRGFFLKNVASFNGWSLGDTTSNLFFMVGRVDKDYGVCLLIPMISRQKVHTYPLFPSHRSPTQDRKNHEK